MEERVKILEIYTKSEEKKAFSPYFCTFTDFHSDYVKQNCHVLVTTLYNFNLACQLE